MYVSIQRSGAPIANNIENLPGEYTPDDTSLGTGQNKNQRKVQYASLKVPLKLWLEFQLRQSTICLQIYVWIDEKERITGHQQLR